MSTDAKKSLREAFEAWAKPRCIDLRADVEGYVDEVTYEAWKAFQHAHKLAWDAQQAIIDRLMLEHCPPEMTPEQLANWENSQRRAKED